MIKMVNFDGKFNEYLNFFEKSLEDNLKSLDNNAPDVIKDAMIYAVNGGGKRVRPILCYSTAEMLGGTIDSVKEFALAIEFIHSYSLVHDDLPAMDNDDYRRGKLSTHKKFGEDIGILAGDALLNYAFETALTKKDFSSADVSALKILSEYAGYSGMIGGQVLDLLGEKNSSPKEEDMYAIFLNKTAKLLTAPLLIASILNDGKYYDELKEYGYHIGILFQITDDILDVFSTLEELGKTPHKDESENKITAVKVFGIDGAKDKAEYHYKSAKEIIGRIDCKGFLTEFTDRIYFRKK